MNMRNLTLVESLPAEAGRERGLHVAVLVSDREQRSQLCKMLEDQSDIATLSPLGGTLDKLAFVPGSVPDVLILHTDSNETLELDALEALLQRHPELACLLVCPPPTPEFLLQAMRAGVREVLGSPPDGQALRQCLERLRRRIGLAAPRKGKVAAFIPCKGGSGSTFLAANLAYALAAKQGQRVALIDINLQFGDALMFLSDQAPASNLSHVAQEVHRLDAAFLAASMVNVDDQLAVLAAPEDPAQGTEVTPAHVEAIIELARRHYDWIVLDVARTLDAPTVKALDHADVIFTVLQNTLPFIRDARRMLDVFRTLDYPDSKVSLVVNRHEKGGDIRIEDMERSLGRSVERIVPNHYEAAAASVNQGVPILSLAKGSALTRALLEWADDLAPRESTSRHWIARMFKRA